METFWLVLLSCQLVASGAVRSTVPLSLTKSQLDPDASRSLLNVEYYMPITLGGEDLTVCIDAEDSIFYVHGPECNSTGCQGHRAYLGTGQVSDGTFDVGGAAAASGFGASGNTTSASLSMGSPAVMLPSQVVGVANFVGDGGATISCDGYMGLAFPPASNLAMNPVFAMVQSGLLDSSGWSVYLNPDKSAINAGQLILGGNDTSLYTGDLKSYAVLEPFESWAIPLTEVQVNGATIEVEANVTIFDHGATGILLSDDDAAAIAKGIPRLAYWADAEAYNVTGDCSDLSDLPTISFVLGDDVYSLPPSAWVAYPMSDFLPSDPNLCISSIFAGGEPGQVLLGTYFLRTFYSSFTFDLSGDAVQSATVSLAKGVTNPSSR